MSDRRAMSEVRLSELKIGLSSSDDPMEGDTAIFVPRKVRAFHAFKEVCALDDETLPRFKNKFQFPDKVRVRLLVRRNELTTSRLGRYASIKLPS